MPSGAAEKRQRRRTGRGKKQVAKVLRAAICKNKASSLIGPEIWQRLQQQWKPIGSRRLEKRDEERARKRDKECARRRNRQTRWQRALSHGSDNKGGRAAYCRGSYCGQYYRLATSSELLKRQGRKDAKIRKTFQCSNVYLWKCTQLDRH